MNGVNRADEGWTRRGFLWGSTAAMAAAYGLRPAHTLSAIPDEFDGSKFQLAAPEPNPKRGGVLRVGILNRLPHFDFQQSGTVGSIGSQGCMYDNLIRHDPRDSGKTIIPDLAHSWDISKDGTTYTFLLRKGVQFHDGAELTSADVKATFDRITKPPAGVSIPRSILFKSLSEIAVPDKYTVQFKLAARDRRASSWRLLPAAGTASCASRRWKRTATICARCQTSPALARTSPSDGWRTKSG
jgi:ABC-type transport system substrate-binding protein